MKLRTLDWTVGEVIRHNCVGIDMVDLSKYYVRESLAVLMLS